VAVAMVAVAMVAVAMVADLAAEEDETAVALVEVAALVAEVGLAVVLALALAAGDLAVVAPEAEAVLVGGAEEALEEVAEADRLLFGKHFRSWRHSQPCWFHSCNKVEDVAQCKTLAGKQVAVRVEEEDLATWDLADKVADAGLVVMEPVAPVVMEADVAPVAVVTEVEEAEMVVVTEVEEVEMVAAVVTEVEDATAGDAETVAVRLVWVEVVCQHLVKVVAGNQKLRNGMLACLTPWGSIQLNLLRERFGKCWT
jgi:hypothetical protein